VTKLCDHLIKEIDSIRLVHVSGRVSAVRGLLIDCKGIAQHVSIGARCEIITPHMPDKSILCEVVGFRDDVALLMPFTSVDGVGLGAQVRVTASSLTISPCEAWLGRVINAFGEPIDGKGPLPKGSIPYALKASPPLATARQRVGGKLNLGIRAINTFITCCTGQRIGIFSGSGVGKSILMSMFARYSSAHVNVIGLVGERGREVQEFIQDDLGEEGLKRSVVVVATSSESALMRRQAAYATMTVAEYFRDQQKDVLCLMDSVTRFAMAQREIGLSAGEPPTTKGYTPTVFSELPKLLERAGPGIKGQGTITGLFSVLVEGDDTNEPIADATRGILDGHLILDRAIAERGRYPAIDILKSVSRMLPDCNSEAENLLTLKARRLMSAYEDMAELIRLGAYRSGSDPQVDQAISFHPALENFLSQRQDETTTLEECYAQLAGILGIEWGVKPEQNQANAASNKPVPKRETAPPTVTPAEAAKAIAQMTASHQAPPVISAEPAALKPNPQKADA
jgi:flagellum-specific ATP synthase